MHSTFTALACGRANSTWTYYSSTKSSQAVPTDKRPEPLQLRQVSSRKGRKYTQSQLAAKKPRVQLTLNKTIKRTLLSAEKVKKVK